MNSLKKVFSAVVSFVTILWSVGAGALAFPVSAQAATLVNGDLIKASGPAVYFYATDGKRYVFPDEKTYFSWYNDFSAVKTITDAELAAIMIGGNVTVRPGTKLVKITTDPKTYAVTKCGTLHWIESEAIAKALYGDAWATRVIDVPDSFFVNYTTGASVSSNVHPDGSLVTYAGDANRYVVMNGQKRKLAGTALTDNKFNAINVITTTISYPDGADVTGLEADNFWSVSCGSGSTSVNGSVTVALASDTPSGATVPKNAMGVPMVKVNLTAGSADALVSGMRFHRVGVGSTSDFANVYLYDQDGNRLTTGRSVNATTNVTEFNSLNVTIPAGGMKSYYVYADFNSPTVTGGNHAFELVDAASVVLTGTGTVSGSFPVRGNVFVIGASSAGTLTIQPGPTPANPVIGSKNVEISSFKLTANTNDIRVNRVALYQGGTVDNSDLSNFELYQGSTKVASAASINAKGQIVLTFDTAYLIPNGVTRVFSLRGDVAGRSGRTIVTYIEYAADINATDTVYNSGASITISAFDTSAEGVSVTTQGGNLSFAFNGPPSANVAKGKLSVPFYKFALTSADNDLEIRYLRFTLAGNSANDLIVGSASTKYFRNIKIYNLDTGATIMGPKELTSAASSTSEALVFNDTFTLKAGTTLNLALAADLSNTEDVINEFYLNGTHKYKATFSPFIAGDVKVVSTGESLDITKIVPNASTAGNVQTIKSSSLTADLASNPVSATVVKKSINKSVVGISLSAGAQSDVTITNLTLTCKASLAGVAYAVGSCVSRVASLSLWDGATQVGIAKAPDTTLGTAQITNMNLKVLKGTTKDLTVKATFTSTAATTAPFDKVEVGIAANGDITAQDDDANTVTASVSTALKTTQLGAAPSVYTTILSKGNITVSADAHPSTSIVVAGKDVWVPFARYKATAQYEDMQIDRITVSSTTGGDNADFVAIGIATGGAIKSSNVLSSGAIGSVDIDLTGNEFTVLKDSSTNFELWAKLSNVSPSSSVNGATTNVARSGHAPGIGIRDNLQTGEWDTNYASKLNIRTTGVSSGERVYAASGAAAGNTQVIRKTKPVVTKQNLTNTVLSAGELELYRAQVGADSAGSIALKQMVFNISKSANVGLSSFRLYRGSTLVPTGEYTIVNSTSATDIKAAQQETQAGVNSFKAIVAFTGEDSISGSGNIYSLRATVAYTGTGNNVTTSFYRDPTAPVVTGYLSTKSTGIFAVSSTSIFNLDQSAAGGAPGASLKLGTFVWSDNSEVPHASTAVLVGSIPSTISRDWSNDVNVEDLSSSASLSN
ncbi:MAG: hypothetical protein WCW31_00175 [Patescibacteria group bacterium]